MKSASSSAGKPKMSIITRRGSSAANSARKSARPRRAKASIRPSACRRTIGSYSRTRSRVTMLAESARCTRSSGKSENEVAHAAVLVAADAGPAEDLLVQRADPVGEDLGVPHDVDHVLPARDHEAAVGQAVDGRLGAEPRVEGERVHNLRRGIRERARRFGAESADLVDHARHAGRRPLVDVGDVRDLGSRSELDPGAGRAAGRRRCALEPGERRGRGTCGSRTRTPSGTSRRRPLDPEAVRVVELRASRFAAPQKTSTRLPPGWSAGAQPVSRVVTAAAIAPATRAASTPRASGGRATGSRAWRRARPEF